MAKKGKAPGVQVVVPGWGEEEPAPTPTQEQESPQEEQEAAPEPQAEQAEPPPPPPPLAEPAPAPATIPAEVLSEITSLRAQLEEMNRWKSELAQKEETTNAARAEQDLQRQLVEHEEAVVKAISDGDEATRFRAQARYSETQRKLDALNRQRELDRMASAMRPAPPRDTPKSPPVDPVALWVKIYGVDAAEQARIKPIAEQMLQSKDWGYVFSTQPFAMLDEARRRANKSVPTPTATQNSMEGASHRGSNSVKPQNSSKFSQADIDWAASMVGTTPEEYLKNYINKIGGAK